MTGAGVLDDQVGRQLVDVDRKDGADSVDCMSCVDCLDLGSRGSGESLLQRRGPADPEVVDEVVEDRDVIADIAEGLVAVEAEQAAHLPGRVVVIHMLGIRLPASRAPTILHRKDALDVHLPDAVPATKVVLAATAV